MSILKDEITNDPLNRGYTEMTDEEVAADINLLVRTRNRPSMTSSEVLNAINITEWISLTDAEQQQIWDVIHMGNINPFGVEATIFIAIFGNGSDTITTLAAARVENVTRATELGHGFVYPGHVQNARM